MFFRELHMKWYKININDCTDEQYEYWYNLMSENKKSRVDKYRFDDAKKRTVFGEMLARKAIADLCKVDIQTVEIEAQKNQKPYAKGIDVHFSISHSKDVVVCAVSDKPIGIDVEKIRPINLSVAKRVCTDDELLEVFGRVPKDDDFGYTDNTQVLTRFFKQWCAKEAYVKCSGKGLSSGLEHTPENKSFVQDGYVICICQQQEDY